MSDVEKKVLQSLEKEITVTTAEKINPKEFFKTRDGLYIFSDFVDRIVSKAEPVESGTEYKLDSSKLVAFANDAEIEAELPEKHIFSESEICAVIASLIEKQSKGEEGALSVGYDWNLFYTPNFVVVVDWRGTDWRVDAWERRGDGYWLSSRRVFSPATDN